MPSELRLHRDAEVTRIELAAADRAPRLSQALLARLAKILGELFQDGRCVGVVIHGSDRAFAAGAELAEVNALSPIAALSFAERTQALFAEIATAPKPVVAPISGHCLGGGVDLALACWRRLSTPEAVFGHPGATLGLVTGWGGTQRLARAVGPARALELLLTGTRITGTKAHQMGLVDMLAPADKLLPAAVAEARALGGQREPLRAHL